MTRGDEKPEWQEWQVLGESFVDQYYYLLDNTDRKDMIGLYGVDSCISREGLLIHGEEAILSKLASQPLTAERVITSLQAQSTPSGGIVISVLGQLQGQGGPTNKIFHQTFLLKGQGNGWYCIYDLYKEFIF